MKYPTRRQLRGCVSDRSDVRAVGRDRKFGGSPERAGVGTAGTPDGQGVRQTPEILEISGISLGYLTFGNRQRIASMWVFLSVPR